MKLGVVKSRIRPERARTAEYPLHLVHAIADPASGDGVEFWRHAVIILFCFTLTPTGPL
jgi:hypothetical protein